MHKPHFYQFALTLFLCCFGMASAAHAANAPAVTLDFTSDPNHPFHRPAWFFPGETASFHTTITGNPDYLVNDPNNQGGGWAELWSNGAKVAQTRITSGNTTFIYWVSLPICSQCNPPAYGPFFFGSPTNIDTPYTFPSGVQGTRTFFGKFGGDAFTSSAASSTISVTVSCSPRAIVPPPRPPAPQYEYPPGNSGCP